MGRGVYGQNEGNETRQATAVMGERLSDNEICEGDVVATIGAMFKDTSRWGQIDSYTADLKKKGWSHARIESVVSRATFQMPSRLRGRR